MIGPPSSAPPAIRTSARVLVTVVAVVLALALTGWASAQLSFGSAPRAVARNIAGGLFAMAVTFAIGSALGTQIG